MPEANPDTGALTINDAAQKLTGLLGDGAEAKDDAPETEAVDQPEPEGQPEGEPNREADTEQDAQPAEDGDKETEPAEIDLTAEGNRKIKVKVNGKTVTMTLAEAAKGVQLEHDYRAKTSDVAEQRKAFEAERAGWTTERQNHAASLRTLYEAFQAPLVGQPPTMEMLDPSNAKYDPASYMLQKAQYEERVGKYRQSVQELDRMQAQDQARAQQASAAQLKEQRAALVEAIPDFGDPVKGQKLSADIRATLQKDYGITASELASMSDARMVRIAHDAHRWRTAGANLKAKQADPKIGPTLKAGVGKPASVVQSEQKKSALERHKRGGSIESGAAALAALANQR